MSDKSRVFHYANEKRISEVERKLTLPSDGGTGEGVVEELENQVEYLRERLAVLIVYLEQEDSWLPLKILRED